MSVKGSPPRNEKRSLTGAAGGLTTGAIVHFAGNGHVPVPDGSAKTVDLFLLPKIDYLKRSYKAFGDPHIVLLAAVALADAVAPVPASRQSFQSARLQTLMSEMLIAEGLDVASVSTARNLVERAMATLEAADMATAEVIKAQVEQSLYRAIACKALGDSEEALRELRTTIERLSRRHGASYVDLLMLYRQEAMMHQDHVEHRKLVEEATQYCHQRPVEYYGTIKRVFEFAMNRRPHDAKRIFPEFRRAYVGARRKLPLLSHISFMKNVGQFLGQNGKTAEAIAVLDRAGLGARQMNLFAQERQAALLVDDFKNNRTRGLITFRVER